MSLITPLLAQEAKLERYVENKDNKPVYQPPETIKCRVQKTVARQLSGQMAQLTSNTKLFMVGAPVPVGSRVTYGDAVFKVGDCKECWTWELDHLELMLI